jgi:hypothetical protein
VQLGLAIETEYEMKSDRQRAREYGTTVKKLREVEARLRAMPMDLFLDGVFGPGKAVYDPGTDLWIVADPKHTGPGFGFIAVRRDKSWFCGVVQPDVLQ